MKTTIELKKLIEDLKANGLGYTWQDIDYLLEGIDMMDAFIDAEDKSRIGSAFNERTGESAQVLGFSDNDVQVASGQDIYYFIDVEGNIEEYNSYKNAIERFELEKKECELEY